MKRTPLAWTLATSLLCAIGVLAARPAPAPAPAPLQVVSGIGEARPDPREMLLGKITARPLGLPYPQGTGGQGDLPQRLGPALPARVPPWHPATLAPVFGTDVFLSGGAESAIGSNPTNPLNFVAGTNPTNINLGGTFFATLDGGQTWSSRNLPGGGDPAVAFDSAGRAYVIQLDPLITSLCPDLIRLWKSTDGGLTYGAYVTPFTTSSPNNHFYDKPWLTVDNNPTSPYTGRIYVTTTDFRISGTTCSFANITDSPIILAYSDDQGASWSAQVTVNDASHDQNTFSQPVVAADGSLYVGYQYQICINLCTSLLTYQLIARSTDGGVTFSPPMTITGAPIVDTGAFTNGNQFYYASSTTTGFRHNDMPVIAVSPTNPNEIYAIWNDGRFETTFVYQSRTGRHGDIVFTRSTDGGQTWSPPVKINDDPLPGKDQFFPWMTVGNDGTIHVAWMDRRDAPVDGFPYREYYTQSSDGGLTWASNQAVSDVAGVPGSFIGDYQGIAVNGDNSRVIPVWTDTRGGTQAYTDVGLIPVPTATATGTATASPTITNTPLPTATTTATPTTTNTPLPTATTTTTASPTYTVTNTPGTIPATRTNTPTVTQTFIPPPTLTFTATATWTRTATATSTLAATATATVTITSTAGVAHTATATATTTCLCPLTPTATATATQCAISFSDVTDPSAYYYQPVYYLACHGVIGGYSDGTYRPFNNTTRGQMAKIVVLGFALPIQTPAGGYTFADNPPGSTFFDYVETAAAASIVSGYPCGGTNPQTGQVELCDGTQRPYYRPGNFVTRGQLSKIVVIAASQVRGWALLNPPTATFNDVPPGSTFYEYIETAVCHGVVNGYADGTFRPAANAFRGQIAKIVYLALTGSGCGP